MKFSPIAALFLPADTSVPADLFDIHDKSIVKVLYERIGCDLVERVSVQPEVCQRVGRMALWIDESGLLKNSPRINLRASILAGRELYGNAVLCGDSGADIESLPLNKMMMAFVVALSAEAVELQRKIDAGTFIPDRML